ncbi:MAG: hypothetical protein GC159_23305 [Phycisphaera sp.]|nr:hypothetical protein [Phycisphaera sp.]
MTSKKSVSPRALRFQEPEPLTKDQVEEIMSANDIDRLITLPLSLGLYCDDAFWGVGKCIDLAKHGDSRVRGHAIRAFGHFARRFRIGHKELAGPLIASALSDQDTFVREQARIAADEIDTHCLWKVDRKGSKKS